MGMPQKFEDAGCILLFKLYARFNCILHLALFPLTEGLNAARILYCYCKTSLKLKIFLSRYGRYILKKD